MKVTSQMCSPTWMTSGFETNPATSCDREGRVVKWGRSAPLEREMHALVPAVLLRLARLSPRWFPCSATKHLSCTRQTLFRCSHPKLGRVTARRFRNQLSPQTWNGICEFQCGGPLWIQTPSCSLVRLLLSC